MDKRRGPAALKTAVGVIALALGLSAEAQAQTAQGQTSYPGGIWEPGPAEYGAEVVEDVPVTMDDGVVLRAMIAYPTDLQTGERIEGEFPVVVEHTPYVQLREPIVPNTFLTEHGYIYAVVRARGAGKSEGELQYNAPRDGMDGKVIADWAANDLEGSDGRVALLGCSYPAALAMTGAGHIGPGSPVKAIVAACNGLMQQNRETFGYGGLQTTSFSTIERIIPYIGDTPSAKALWTDMIEDIAAGGDKAYDREFWADRQSLYLNQRLADSEIPILLWAGWRDSIEATALRTYFALQNAYAGRDINAPMTADQPVTSRYQIIMGPWGHAAGLDAGIYLQWLDTWVKEIDTGIGETEAPMHAYEMGTDRWVNLRGFPITSDYTTWHLNSDGGLQLEAAAETGSQELIWGAEADAGGKISFTTPPIEEGATLGGPFSATLYASSSNTNLEILAKLYDVAPDGAATMMSFGAVVGSLREIDEELSWRDAEGTLTWPWPTLEADDYLEPDQVYQLDVALFPRLWGVRPGHRLRLELSSHTPSETCQQPLDPCELTAPQQETLPGGRYRVMTGGEWPSALHLPQVAADAFEPVQAAILPTGWSESYRRMEVSEFTLPLDWKTTTSQ